jgi:Protein of unknown function (DUF3987)
VLSAALEQKVWVRTTSDLYPNLYVLIVGHPGRGKSRIISVARGLVRGLLEQHVAPVSATFAALVDALDSAQRAILIPGAAEPHKYNALYICADELGAFIHKYDAEMMSGLTAFYDTTPYQQRRRSLEHVVDIESPQLNLLMGTTPQNLATFMPKEAWGQGFASRIIMIFNDDRIIEDDFADAPLSKMPELEKDLQTIANLHGRFHVSPGYKEVVWTWRQADQKPEPSHPKLEHYNSRRKANIYKLSMIASVDRGNTLALMPEDFQTALRWLEEAEFAMHGVFDAGATSFDGQAMNAVAHQMSVIEMTSKYPVCETKINELAMNYVNLNQITKMIEALVAAGQIRLTFTDPVSGWRYFTTKPLPPKSRLVADDDDIT